MFKLFYCYTRFAACQSLFSFPALDFSAKVWHDKNRDLYKFKIMVECFYQLPFQLTISTSLRGNIILNFRAVVFYVLLQPRRAKERCVFMNFDVVIVGAGPAGIFTALELIRKGSRKRIAIIEKNQLKNGAVLNRKPGNASTASPTAILPPVFRRRRIFRREAFFKLRGWRGTPSANRRGLHAGTH